MQKDWNVIINPNSGNFRLNKNFQVVKDAFASNNITAEFHFTTGRHHAEKISSELLQRGKTSIAVAGGDGTLNEVVNGIFSAGTHRTEETVLCVIPAGTGNDWCKSFGVPSDFCRAVELINEGRMINQDIGKICFGTGSTRYFANAAGFGFDAEVASRVNMEKSKNSNGKLVFLKNLLMSLLKSESRRMRLTVDDETIEEEIFSIAVGIGKYNGGGMMQLPAAVVDDGLFDITIIKKISKLQVIINTKNLYDGTFISHKSVISMKAKKIAIVSEHTVLAETEGEPVGECPCTIEILPDALGVITGFK
jgi:YegS/Rv2252/BmrU family lipid kinase